MAGMPQIVGGGAQIGDDDLVLGPVGRIQIKSDARRLVEPRVRSDKGPEEEAESGTGTIVLTGRIQ